MEPTIETTDPKIQNIIDQYKRHQKQCNKWKKDHPAQNSAYVKKYVQNLKTNDPDKYQEYLDRNNVYYHTVAKPKRIAAKAAAKAAKAAANII